MCHIFYIWLFLDLFDKDGSGDVDFVEFLKGFNHFSEKEDRTAKLRCVFK